MTFIHKTLVTLALTLMPFTAIAANAPSNITRIDGSYANGVLSVIWTPATDPSGISFYNVYYSHESILGNDGNYDDFERTAGAQTTYTFKALPLTSQKIYISVLAVSKAGVESDGFETEAVVEIGSTISSASSQSSSIQSAVSSSAMSVSSSASSTTVSSSSGTQVQTSTAIPMAILDVHAISSTGEIVVFSKPVSPQMQYTPGIFLLKDMSGTVLTVTRVTASGTALLVDTAPQIAEKGYAVGVLLPVPAADGTNMPAFQNPIPFTGFATVEQPASSQSSQSSEPVPYIRNPNLGSVTPPTKDDTPAMDPLTLALTSVLRTDGTYNVFAEWLRNPARDDIRNAYMVYTSRDGKRFSTADSMGIMENSAEYKGIAPGLFGVKVTAKDAEGNESAGIQRVINLPESGLGLLGIMAISGFVAGGRIRRKKTA